MSNKMSEYQRSLIGEEVDRSTQKYAHLYEKSIEDLHDELAALNEAVANGTVELDLIDAYLDAISKKEQLPFDDFDSAEAYAVFSEKHAFLFEENSNIKPYMTRRYHLLPRKIVAVIVAAVLCCSVIASASGFDLWGAVARWTKDVFSFELNSSNSSYPESKEEFRDMSEESSLIQEKLDELAIEEKVVPWRIPEGFVLVDSEVTPMKNSIKVRNVFQKDSEEFAFTIRHFSTIDDAVKAQVEKTEENVEAYIVENISHYILQNTDVQSVTWLNNTVLCVISGDLSEEDIKLMIDSIYER